MKCIDVNFIAALCLLFMASCTSGKAFSEAETVTCVEYIDTVYCFNGRYIVTAAEGKGIIDEDGGVVVDAEYDDIEFLNDDVALLTDEGVSYLATRDGRFFAEDFDTGFLEESFLGLYENLLHSDALFWDEVLDDLDRLCVASVGIKGNRLTENMEAVRLFEALKNKLKGEHGNMNDVQRCRLEEVEVKFHTYRK